MDYYQSQDGYDEQGRPAVAGAEACCHDYVTGADGSVYCRNCGAVLRTGAYDAYRSQRAAAPPERHFRHWGLVVLAGVIVLAVVGFLGWSYATRRPAPVASADPPETIDLANEPVQQNIADPQPIYNRADGMYFMPGARYKIWAKVLGVRVFAEHDKGETGFPIDLGLAWGDVGKADYEKYVDIRFSKEYSANQWLMFQFKTADPPWPGPYFNSHVSNNHVCPATENLYNAILSLKKGDIVMLEGYLAGSMAANGQPVLGSSLTRDDTDAGACEAFFIQKLQVDDKVYK